jgi:hypothetical protein
MERSMTKKKRKKRKKKINKIWGISPDLINL